MALKGAKLRQFFFTNTSSCAAKLLVEDMQAMGDLSGCVTSTRRRLSSLTLPSAAKGEIIIAKSRGEDELTH